MKKIIYILALGALATGSYACKGFLETESPSTMLPENVYTSLDFTNKAILGIYTNMTTDRLYGQSMAINMQTGSDTELRRLAGTTAIGDYSRVGEGNNERAIGNHVATPATNYLPDIWTQLYRVVELADLAVYGIENSSLYRNGTTAERTQMGAYLGEAVVLRAFCYMELARVWGNVPFKLEPTNAGNTNLPKTDVMTIYERLIEDIDRVADLLPWATPGQSTERVTRGFAKGLTARLALYRAGKYYTTANAWAQGSEPERYYAIARDRCREVMQSGAHDLHTATGYAPGNPFKNLFYTECQRANDPQGERMFELGMGFTATGDKSGEIGYLMGAFTNSPKYGIMNAQILTPISYFYSFDASDMRRDISVTFTRGTGTSASGASDKQTIPSTLHDLYIGKWSIKWMTQDYVTANKSTTDKTQTGVNYCAMRYADVLLMFAEAVNALNDGANMPAARDAFKRVRARAFPATSYGDKVSAYVDNLAQGAAFQQAIENERMWEFAGESVRKYDLIRWGKFAESIKTMKENSYAIYVDHTNPYTGQPLPETLYWKYKADGEDIDAADAKFYTVYDTPPSGYTGSQWLVKTTVAPADNNSVRFLDQIVSGIVKATSAASPGTYVIVNQCPYRPIASSIIADSRGVLKNDYGF